ncbi:hypothetical protein V8F20_002146 [Naviculisporaceae sp. PSN 640]
MLGLKVKMENGAGGGPWWRLRSDLGRVATALAWRVQGKRATVLESQYRMERYSVTVCIGCWSLDTSQWMEDSRGASKLKSQHSQQWNNRPRIITNNKFPEQVQRPASLTSDGEFRISLFFEFTTSLTGSLEFDENSRELEAPMLFYFSCKSMLSPLLRTLDSMALGRRYGSTQTACSYLRIQYRNRQYRLRIPNSKECPKWPAAAGAWIRNVLRRHVRSLEKRDTVLEIRGV